MTATQQRGRPTSDRDAVAPFARLLPADGHAGRREALERALALGLPTQLAEAWRHTSLAGLAKHHFTLPGAAGALDSAPSLLPEADRLVFLDGLAQAGLTHLGVLPAGAALATGPGDAALAKDASALAALNAALSQDGASLTVGAGTALPRPLELQFVNALAEGAVTAQPRLRVALGARACAVLVEQHRGLGAAPRFLNHQADIALAEGATLTHLVVVAEGAGTTHLAETRVTVAKDARYETLVLQLGGQLVRRDLRVTLAARGAQALVNGAYLLLGQEQADLVTEIVHAAPDTTSRETLKGALAGESRQDVQACITMLAGAARGDGRLANKTLLLADRATIWTKPELKIFHDEVQAAHGATSGKLDAAALFYLRSRGLPLATARRLLIASFLAETLEGFTDDLVEPLRALIATRLAEIQP